MATPEQETGRRKEYNDETSIHSELVSHSAQPASLDDIPVHSVCGVAGALVSFSDFYTAAAVGDCIHDDVSYKQCEQAFRRRVSGCDEARRHAGVRGIGSSSPAESC